MIRLSKLTDYAIVVMTQMARAPERPLHTARDLAAETQLPLPTVSKILKQLLTAGLLVSHRGVKGGYTLSRAPREISVGQIIAAIEGPVGATECSSGVPGLCDLEPHCPMSSNWRIISLALRQALENLTLPDLIYPLQFADSNSNMVPAMNLISGRTQ
ncbi:MAG: SUF system Fe-S cluster assembly regulator [Terriglobales bacterium]